MYRKIKLDNNLYLFSYKNLKFMYFFAYIIKMPLFNAVAFLCPKDCVKLF